MTTYNAFEIKRLKSLQGVELASFTRRAAACMIDVVILSLLFFIILSLLEPIISKLGWMKSGEELVFALNLNWYSIVWVVLFYGLSTYIGNGKTPGKLLLRIRVVSLVHTKMSLWHSIERALGYGVSLAEFGFGFIQYFIHPNKRTLHDRIAETIVIHETQPKQRTEVISEGGHKTTVHKSKRQHR